VVPKHRLFKKINGLKKAPWTLHLFTLYQKRSPYIFHLLYYTESLFEEVVFEVV